MSKILDPDFAYRSAAATNVMDTFKRFGFKPTTQAQRLARKKPKVIVCNVRPLRKAKA